MDLLGNGPRERKNVAATVLSVDAIPSPCDRIIFLILRLKQKLVQSSNIFFHRLSMLITVPILLLLWAGHFTNQKQPSLSHPSSHLIPSIFRSLPYSFSFGAFAFDTFFLISIYLLHRMLYKFFSCLFKFDGGQRGNEETRKKFKRARAMCI